MSQHSAASLATLGQDDFAAIHSSHRPGGAPSLLTSPMSVSADYVTSWLTHGLLEAAVAGEEGALALLREHFDWFNAAGVLPLFLPPAEPTFSPFADRQSEQFVHGHEIYLICTRPRLG